jgi:hypothetical protein
VSKTDQQPKVVDIAAVRVERQQEKVAARKQRAQDRVGQSAAVETVKKPVKKAVAKKAPVKKASKAAPKKKVAAKKAKTTKKSTK